MPWFVCFEHPPATAHGFHRNRVGLSVPDHLSKDEAIAEVRQSLEGQGHQNLTFFDAYQYQENDQ